MEHLGRTGSGAIGRENVTRRCACRVEACFGDFRITSAARRLYRRHNRTPLMLQRSHRASRTSLKACSSAAPRCCPLLRRSVPGGLVATSSRPLAGRLCARNRVLSITGGVESIRSIEAARIVSKPVFAARVLSQSFRLTNIRESHQAHHPIVGNSILTLVLLGPVGF